MSPFDGSPVVRVAGFAFTAILVVAAIGDIRTRRIPNRIVVILAVMGLAFSVLKHPVFGGLISSGEGLLVGLVCWLPFYAFGWLGAGDVKLYAAAGAWLGPGSAIEGALIAALAGALLSFIWMVKSHGVSDTGRTLGLAAATPRILSPKSDGSGRSDRIPYGVAIAFGALWAGWMPGMLVR